MNGDSATAADEASAQLHDEHRISIARALAARRPILHHLNADTSWLLQIPRPPSAIRFGSRIYYNILIDPWFTGGQSDVADWFSQQWHAEPSAAQSIKDVEALIRGVEELASLYLPSVDRGRGSRKSWGNRKSWGSRRSSGLGADTMDVDMEDGKCEASEGTVIDAVAISHEFTDHCHRETLMEVHRDVPVFAAEKAALLITTFNHFRNVQTIPPFSSSSRTLPTDWRDLSIAPLPTWLSISRITVPRDGLFYHSALLFSFNTFSSSPKPTPQKHSRHSTPGSFSGSFSGSLPSTPSSSDPYPVSERAEAVLYTPHGLSHTGLTPLISAAPPIKVLAFLHGLHSVRISGASQLNLGAENGVRAQRILKAKYWVGTHDEVKKGGGLIGWFLNRKKWTVKEALEKVRKDLEEMDKRRAKVVGDGNSVLGKRKAGDEWEDVRFEEVGNGESRVLV